MTTETTDYSTLEPRALDALVAERVMGLTRIAGKWRDPIYRTPDDHVAELMAYSTDPAAAFTVLEAMRAKGWPIAIYTELDEIDAWLVTIEGVSIMDRTLPRAAVIAALRALDAEDS